MKKETTYIFDAHDIGKALDIGGYSTARTTLEDAENILLQTVETLRGYKTLFKVPNSPLYSALLLNACRYQFD